MKRRQFIKLVGVAAAFAPIAARAQQGKIATLGVLLTGAANRAHNLNTVYAPVGHCLFAVDMSTLGI